MSRPLLALAGAAGFGYFQSSNRHLVDISFSLLILPRNHRTAAIALKLQYQGY